MTRRMNWPVLAVAVLAAAYLATAPLWMEEVRFGYLARWMAFAMVGLGIGLAWGYGGMMTLGQGVFFGLGGYAVAMHFQLASMPEGQPVPEWMMLRNIEELPALWEPLRSPWFAVGTVLLLPALVAVLLGLLVFRRRVRGAYFAVLTQALAAAFVILLVGQQKLIGGTNGLTGIQYAFGLNRYDPQTKKVIYFIVLATLGVLFVAGWWLVSSRFGRLLVAVRDGEDRVRFLGYDPAVVKTVAFALSATCAGIGGAMFVLAVGSINPSLMGIVPSIEMLIGVALGGRFVLVGAVAGTLLFHYAKTTLSETWEENWNYFYGGLFIALMVFAPRGLVGLIAQGWDALGRLATRRRPVSPPEPAEAAA
jgi:urea transport system permease protein